MISTVLVGLTIGITIILTALASSSTILTSAYASSREAPCSPPVEDPDDPGVLIERCANRVCSIDAETGERIGCSGEGGGLTRVCPDSEFMEERFLNPCIVTTP